MRGRGRVYISARRKVIGGKRWQSPSEAKHTRPVSPGWGEDGSFNKSEQGNEVVRQASPARLSPQLGRRRVARRTAKRRDIFRVERLGNEARPPVRLLTTYFPQVKQTRGCLRSEITLQSRKKERHAKSRALASSQANRSLLQLEGKERKQKQPHFTGWVLTARREVLRRCVWPLCVFFHSTLRDLCALRWRRWLPFALLANSVLTLNWGRNYGWQNFI